MSKKSNPEGAKMKRALPFKLSDEEKARKGELAGELNKKLDVALELKASEVAKHNERVKGLTKDIHKTLTAIAEGVERREVQCVEHKNFDKNTVEYWFEGEMIEDREMKQDDRQLALADEKKPKKEKWQRMGPKGKHTKTDPEDDVTEEEREIASVHKMETSRKGASSAVDPV